jgi:hypothetical protein
MRPMIKAIRIIIIVTAKLHMVCPLYCCAFASYKIFAHKSGTTYVLPGNTWLFLLLFMRCARLWIIKPLYDDDLMLSQRVSLSLERRTRATFYKFF